MKKFNFLLILLICSFLFSFESSENNTSDPLVGTWKIDKLIINYSDGREVETDLSDCTLRRRYSFFSEGTLNYKMTTIDKETGECIMRSNEFWTGTWDSWSRNIYITKNVTTFPSGHVTSYSDSTTVYTFSNMNEILTKFNDYDKAGIIYEGKIRPVSESATFIRVKR
jgi:hypothetical protein